MQEAGGSSTGHKLDNTKTISRLGMQIFVIDELDEDDLSVVYQWITEDNDSVSKNSLLYPYKDIDIGLKSKRLPAMQNKYSPRSLTDVASENSRVSIRLL